MIKVHIEHNFLYSGKKNFKEVLLISHIKIDENTLLHIGWIVSWLTTDKYIYIGLHGTTSFNIRNSFWYNLKPICFNYRLRIICLVPKIPFTDPQLCSLRLSFTHDWLTIENWTKLYKTDFYHTGSELWIQLKRYYYRLQLCLIP